MKREFLFSLSATSYAPAQAHMYRVLLNKLGFLLVMLEKEPMFCECWIRQITKSGCVHLTCTWRAELINVKTTQKVSFNRITHLGKNLERVRISAMGILPLQLMVCGSLGN